MAVNLDLTEGEKLRTFYLRLFKKLIVYSPVNNFSAMSGCFPGLTLKAPTYNLQQATISNFTSFSKITNKA